MRWTAPDGTLILGDSQKCLSEIAGSSIHAIVSDIPYGIGAEEWDVLHNNTNSALLGSSPAQERAGSVFKKRGKPLNGWSEADKQIPREYQNWCETWAHEWHRVLVPGASVFVFAGRRMAHRVILALEDAGFTFKDMIAWVRERAAHRAQRVSVVFDRREDVASSEKWADWRLGNLRPTFEPILWLTKPYRTGGTIADNLISNEVGGYNEAAIRRYFGAPNNIFHASMSRGEGGLHPTQKPEQLMKALIEMTTIEGQTILDPFCGSGTTLVAARATKRHFIGIEADKSFAEIAANRMSSGLFGIPWSVGDPDRGASCSPPLLVQLPQERALSLSKSTPNGYKHNRT